MEKKSVVMVMDDDDENETRGMRLRRKGGLKEEREGCTKCPVCTPALLYDHDDHDHDHVMHFDRTDQQRPGQTRPDKGRPGITGIPGLPGIPGIP